MADPLPVITRALEHAQETIRSLSTQLSSAHDQYAHMQARAAYWRREHDARHAEVGQLKAERQFLRNEVQRASEAAATFFNPKMHALTADRDAALRVADKLSLAIEANKAHISGLRSNLDVFREEKAAVEKTLEKTTSALEHLQGEYKSLHLRYSHSRTHWEHQLRSAVASQRALEEVNHRLTSQREVKTESPDDELAARVFSLTTSLENAERTITLFKQEKQAKRVRIMELQGKLDAAVQDLFAAQRELEIARVGLEEATEAVDQLPILKARIAELERQRECGHEAALNADSGGGEQRCYPGTCECGVERCRFRLVGIGPGASRASLILLATGLPTKVEADCDPRVTASN
ncbi:hypothetical protein MKEN_00485400 [Mycena kentingensis (nom. inval.)]|nr:hypothetical protein MKEN_00485400 [Mycena kentingensis (nom. inval.)]